MTEEMKALAERLREDALRIEGVLGLPEDVKLDEAENMRAAADALEAAAKEIERMRGGVGARAMIERFDIHRLRIADRRPSAKRDEFLGELDFIRRDMLTASSRIRSAMGGEHE